METIHPGYLSGEIIYMVKEITISTYQPVQRVTRQLKDKHDIFHVLSVVNKYNEDLSINRATITFLKQYKVLSL